MRIQAHPAGSALLTPTRRGRRVIWLAGGAGVLLTALGFILRGAPIDAPAVEALNRAHTGAWGQIADAIYFTLEPVPAAFLTLLILITIAVGLRSVRTAIVFGGIVALTWLPPPPSRLSWIDLDRTSSPLFTHSRPRRWTDLSPADTPLSSQPSPSPSGFFCAVPVGRRSLSSSARCPPSSLVSPSSATGSTTQLMSWPPSCGQSRWHPPPDGSWSTSSHLAWSDIESAADLRIF